MGRGCTVDQTPPVQDRKTGRPAGSKNKFSRDSVKVLEAAGFNPIEKLIELYGTIEDEIKTIKKAPKPSAVAIATLRASQRQTIEALLPYGYVKVKPEDVAAKADPITIEAILVKRDKE